MVFLADKKQPKEEKGRKLVKEEIEERRQGQALYEMDQTNAGWQIVKQWLTDRAFHSWVDPRDAPSKKEWEWRELNAFHSADVAKQILEEIRKAVDKAEYLDKVAKGIIQEKRMRF